MPRAIRAASSALSTRNDTIPPNAAIWPAAILVPRMIRQARVVHLVDHRVADKERGDRGGVLAVATHPHAEGSEAAEREERVHRARHGTDRVHQEPDRLDRDRGRW